MSNKLLAAIAAQFYKEIYPEIAFKCIIIQCDEALKSIEGIDNEEEFCEFLKEFSELLENLSKVWHDANEVSNVIRKHIGDINWENYADEHGNHFQLGSVWYNRFSWIIEGSETDEVIEFATALHESVIPFLNELEKQAGESQ